MKKRKACERHYALANAIPLKTESGLVQYYKGDFFTIFVTQPASLLLHHAMKKKHLPQEQPVNLLLQDDNFIFEIYMDHESIQDYEALKEIDQLGTLMPYWSLAMEQAVKAFFNSPLKGPLADRFHYARVIDLILQLVHHINELRQRPPVSESTIKFAEKAKQIILSDLSIYDTVEKIARKVGIQEADLQFAFKQRFGMTVGKFSKDERMKLAHEILETSDETLLSIALTVGYNDPGNFSVAFKNYYGYSPGYIQRKKKILMLRQQS